MIYFRKSKQVIQDMKCRTACKNQELKMCLDIFIVDFVIIINATTICDFLLCLLTYSYTYTFSRRYKRVLSVERFLNYLGHNRNYTLLNQTVYSFPIFFIVNRNLKYLNFIYVIGSRKVTGAHKLLPLWLTVISGLIKTQSFSWVTRTGRGFLLVILWR